SDAPSNYPSETLEAETVTEGVLIDHTPPVLEKLASTEGRIQIRASDALSTIESAEIYEGDRAIAAARPRDGGLDPRVEILEVDRPAPGAGKRTLRVRDSSGNEATLPLD